MELIKTDLIEQVQEHQRTRLALEELEAERIRRAKAKARAKRDEQIDDRIAMIAFGCFCLLAWTILTVLG